LEILEKHVPAKTLECKQRCRDIITESLLEQEHFQTQFTYDLLEARRADLGILDNLLKCFEK